MRIASLLLPWLLLCPGAAALAQSAEPPDASDAGDRKGVYLELVQKALREHELGNWSEAKSFFAQAHAIEPNARTLRGLGLASYELRSYVEAIGHFRKALGSEVRPLTPDMRAQVEELLQQSLGFIARFSLELSPEGASLRVDGHAPVLGEQGELLLDPGPHELVVRADGHTTVTRRIEARANTREALQITLQPKQAALEVRPDPVPAPNDGFFATRTTTQWVGLGLAGGGFVGLGIGSAFGLIALDRDADSEADCEGNRCNEEGLEARNAARSAGNVATAAFIAGGALVAAGAVLYLAGGRSGPEPAPLSLHLSPQAGTEQLGLAVGGRFR